MRELERRRSDEWRVEGYAARDAGKGRGAIGILRDTGESDVLSLRSLGLEHAVLRTREHRRLDGSVIRVREGEG